MFVFEAAAESFFANVPEWRMAQVVRKTGGFGDIRIDTTHVSNPIRRIFEELLGKPSRQLGHSH